MDYFKTSEFEYSYTLKRIYLISISLVKAVDWEKPKN